MGIKKIDIKEVENDIQNMSIDQLREFLCYRFQEIRHTESFGMLIDRLEESEEKIGQLKKRDQEKDIKKGFRKELKELINWHSIEKGSDTPNFVLAEYLTDCLEAFDKAVKKRNEMVQVE